ncbi:MAG: hypothetical protein CMC73_01795 [Flavobacteriaceae bacterium]|nr:hypothetical protein [Flavobacteriaceae bacterium]
MFSQRKHKRFNYKPNHSKKPKSVSNGHENGQFTGYKFKWNQFRKTSKRKYFLKTSLPILILILALLLSGMYFLEVKFL